MKIIIVDDSNFTRKYLKASLVKHHYEVVADFPDAKLTLDYLKDNHVDIAIVDIVMPDISGIELTQMISIAYPKTKVIMMSSLSQERFILESISAGAVDFLPKPIEEVKLFESLGKIRKLVA